MRCCHSPCLSTVGQPIFLYIIRFKEESHYRNINLHQVQPAKKIKARDCEVYHIVIIIIIKTVTILNV